jgi:hypothetical protein
MGTPVVAVRACASGPYQRHTQLPHTRSEAELRF